MNLPIHHFSDLNIATQIEELTKQLDKVSGQAKIRTQDAINRYQAEQIKRQLLQTV